MPVKLRQVLLSGSCKFFVFGLMDAGGWWGQPRSGRRYPSRYGARAEQSLVEEDHVTWILSSDWMQECSGRGEVTIGGRNQAKLNKRELRRTGLGGGARARQCWHLLQHQVTCTLVHKTNYYSNTRRGLFSIELQSPSGTVSQLLAPRPLSGEYLYRQRFITHSQNVCYSSNFANFRTWPLMSTHFWGKDPSAVQ